VLRQYPFRETSVVVSCLTDQFGKIKGLIKGLRGAASRPRYRSPMEPLTLNRIVFYEAHHSSLHLVSQCELAGGFEGLVQDLGAMRLAASCAELVDVLVEPDEPQPSIFALLRSTLARLSDHPSELLISRIHFILRLLRLVGFQPQLDECTGCGRPPAEQRGYWSPKQGGLLCERCLHLDPHAELMESRQLEGLSRSAESDHPYPLQRRDAAAIQQRLDEFLRWRLDRPLKTMRHAVTARG
jgi:DNA repair protein RecO (recombination protein O)